MKTILVLLFLGFTISSYCQTKTIPKTDSNSDLQKQIKELQDKNDADQQNIESQITNLKTKFDETNNLITAQKKIEPKFDERDAISKRDSLLTLFAKTPNDDTKQIQSIKDQLESIAKSTTLYSEWKAKLTDLNEQLQSYTQSILIFSKIKDIEKLSKVAGDAITAANTASSTNISSARESYGGSISAIHLDATTRSFLNSFSGSMIILDKKSNAAASQKLQWLQKLCQLGAIGGAILAYDSYQSDQSAGVAISSGVGVGLLALSGVIEKKISNRLKYSIDAMSRNIIYGEIIRQDSVFVANYKQHAIDANNTIIYNAAGSDGTAIVNSDYWPIDEHLRKADLLVDDLTSASIFFNNIISASESLKKTSLTDEDKKIVANNVAAANSILPILQNYKANLSAQIRFIRQVNKDKQTTDNSKADINDKK